MIRDHVEFRIFKRRVDMEVIIDEVTKRWCKVCYLVINWRIDELVKRAEVRIPPEFYKEMAEYLYAYVYEDQMPPEEIAPTILNVADDFVRGEPVRFRAGDYVAVQDFLRSRG